MLRYWGDLGDSGETLRVNSRLYVRTCYCVRLCVLCACVIPFLFFLVSICLIVRTFLCLRVLAWIDVRALVRVCTCVHTH